MNNLQDKINKTKNARFAASRRMKRDRLYANLAVALFSFYIIVINTLVYLSDFAYYSDKITIVTIWLSIFIVIISQIVAQQQYELKEKNYHDCGNSLNALGDKISLLLEKGEPLTFEQREELINAYHFILSYYQLNHNENDYRWAFRNWSDKKRDFMWAFSCQYIFDASFFYLMLIITGPIIIVLFICI